MYPENYPTTLLNSWPKGSINKALGVISFSSRSFDKSDGPEVAVAES